MSVTAVDVRSLAESLRAVQAARRARMSTSAALRFHEWLPVVSPGWDWEARHLERIREELALVTSGACDQLMIFTPPRHMKTEHTTVRYTAWRIEHDPTLRVIVAAYNQTLAERFSRKIRRIVRDRVPLSDERSAVNEWETTSGGGVRAAGVGGGITGMGGRLIVIDDPVKSREEADSPTYRERVWEWYTDDLYTRREPGAAIVLIMTRWHMDDLAGRILASRDGPNWRVLHLPAIAGVDDPADRAEGEALWPAQYPLEELNRIRLVGDEGERGWWALYQGTPTADDGVIFRREWWDGRNRYDPSTLGDDGWLIRRRVIHWDTAEEAHAGAAYSAGIVGDLQELRDTGRRRLLIRGVRRGRWELPELMHEVEALATAWRYDERGAEVLAEVVVEYASSGRSVVQTMKSSAPYWLSSIMPRGKQPAASKDVRGREAALWCAQDKVLLPWPDASNAGWLAAFEAEVYAVPQSKNRDQADAFAHMVRAYRNWFKDPEPRQEQSIAAD